MTTRRCLIRKAVRPLSEKGALGLTVEEFYTMVCGTANLDLVRSLGANSVIDCAKEDFTKVESEVYDVVFDTVGKSVQEQLRSALCKRHSE